MLSSEEIRQNYEKSIDLALEILNEHYFDHNLSINDWAESLIGSELVVKLIQSVSFDIKVYRTCLLQSFQQLKHVLYLDVDKRFYSSIENLRVNYDLELRDDENKTDVKGDDKDSDLETPEILNLFRSYLDDELEQFLLLLLNKTQIQWRRRFLRRIEPAMIRDKLNQIKTFYPDGHIPDISSVNFNDTVPDDTIIECYKQVFLNILPRFPDGILKYGGDHRAVILTRFLIEKILEITPQLAIEMDDPHLFTSNGLRNVYRYFNHSISRLIQNCYPEIIYPWQKSHVPEGYWENEQNRILATRWLVENKLGIVVAEIPNAIKEKRITKSRFGEHGLSYMFNKYYRSISKVLKNAYLQFEPWELGSVPSNYWDGETGRQNALRAIHWFVNKAQIDLVDLVELIKTKNISRKTFSQYGLATMFEKVFHRNLYDAFNAIFPDAFKPWELGNVPSGFWDNLYNAYQAVRWVAEQEKIPNEDIPLRLADKTISRSLFDKYGLSYMLESVFENDLRNAFLPYLTSKTDESKKEEKILRIIDERMRKESLKENFLGSFLKGMFFKGIIKFNQEITQKKYEHMKRRVVRRTRNFKE